MPEPDSHEAPAPESQVAAARAVPDPVVVQVPDSSASKDAEGLDAVQQDFAVLSTPPPPPPEPDAAMRPAPSTVSPTAVVDVEATARDAEPRPARDATPRDRDEVDPGSVPVDVGADVAAPHAAPLVTDPAADPAVVSSASGPATLANDAGPPPPLPLDDAHAAPPAHTGSDLVPAAADAVPAADSRDPMELLSAPIAPAGPANVQGAQEEDGDVPMDEDEAALEPQAVHVLGESLGTADAALVEDSLREDDGRNAHGPPEIAVLEVEAEVEDAMDVAAAQVANGGDARDLQDSVTFEVEVAAEDDDVMDVALSSPVRSLSPVGPPSSPPLAAADVASETDSDSRASSSPSEAEAESESGSEADFETDSDSDNDDDDPIPLSLDPTILSTPPASRAFKRARTPDAPLDGTTPNAKRARSEPPIHGLAPRETPLPEGVSPWVAAALQRTHAELARVRAVTDTHRAAVALARKVLPASVWQGAGAQVVEEESDEEDEESEEEGEW
ncbi:hypothetical protein AMAG_07904 [Allomyces macrogynus ATCC 38327]|uniref:Uncharacterized protein n=1 Tax=Allomyces macrogynus (strain ATCC 38327) TaxID=578462 RepID=A0A0L0SJQ9_ALLM3|nr:hypothetical protein AMAG_07904 [Allomyces macrogynus ATCC 38327]|eukprot:KNE62717.1 hypothetical protein AMAG_07904 [Allomyces macrogynus ATCC 38327]